MTGEDARAVLLTGPVGCGKTAIAMELGELLAERDLPSAVLDLDWLGWFHGPPGAPAPDELIAENLRVVWPTFRSAGARYLVLARALTAGTQVAALRDAVPDVSMTVALVDVPADVIAERLGRRDAGDVLREHLAESATMAAALAAAGLEDLRIDNAAPSPTVAARGLLDRLGWG
jgi:adenylylsulfate kinase